MPSRQNCDEELLSALRKATPARIGAGRCGTRPVTSQWLKFRQDHAFARDAVNSRLSDEFLQSMESEGFPVIQTLAKDREDYIAFPPHGKQACEEVVESLKSRCITGIDVQIVVSDGLSARAVEINVPQLLPILRDGLDLEGVSQGTPVVALFGRVAIADQIAHALHARLAINLIGERPGLSSDVGLSAYLTYNPGPHTISSDRTVLSNIHERGTPPVEAGAYIVQLAGRILNHKVSGVRLQQLA